MYCMTVTYPVGEDTHFDYDYYQATHMPLCARLLADHGYRGVVMRNNSGKGPGSGGLSYVSVDLLFDSLEQLQAGLAAGGIAGHQAHRRQGMQASRRQPKTHRR